MSGAFFSGHRCRAGTFAPVRQRAYRRRQCRRPPPGRRLPLPLRILSRWISAQPSPDRVPEWRCPPQLTPHSNSRDLGATLFRAVTFCRRRSPSREFSRFRKATVVSPGIRCLFEQVILISKPAQGRVNLRSPYKYWGGRVPTPRRPRAGSGRGDVDRWRSSRAGA